MKKLISILLVIASLFALLTVGASAHFGSGVAVVADSVTMIKSGLVGRKLCFSDTDFKQALCLADFKKVTVTSLPPSQDGALFLGGRRIAAGQSVKRKNLSSLVFIPSSEEVTGSSFTFTVDDRGSEILCTMKFLEQINYAPKIEEGKGAALAVSTQSGVSVFGRLGGSDPEGDELTYIVVSYPTHGRLTLTDEKTGDYRYAPNGSYTGKDTFVYVVRDACGNYSKTAEVTVTVSKRASDVEYVDMTDHPAYNAAVTLTAKGVMAGRLLGDDYYFEPEKGVTRAEFLTMAMKSAGVRADSTIRSTYFDDDADIPNSYRGYVATAQRAGIVSGSFTDGSLIFRPNDPVTVCEAAEILTALLSPSVKGESHASADALPDVPVWARPSVATMMDLGIFESGECATDTLTRGDTARYLYRFLSAGA